MIKEYIKKVIDTANMLHYDEIALVADALINAYRVGKTVYAMGNGGSASTASHFACDMAKATNHVLQVRSLTDNVATLTALANDSLYSEIFIGQLKGVLRPGDVVVGFSGSGNSCNVLDAIKYANKNNAITIGISGYDGGELKKLCKINIHVPINDMQISEDIHLVIVHILMKALQAAV